jgi:hypothetical protein
LNSVYYDLGATYRLKFDDQGRNQLTIGAIVTPEQLLNANLDYGLFYSDDVTDQTQYDTIVPLITNDNGTIRYPQSTTIGFNYAFRPLDKESKLKSIYQISVYADYTKTQWSRFSTEFAQHTSAFTYQDATKWSFGVQYTPSFEFMTKAAGAGFAGKLRYRAGFYTATLPMSQNGIQVSERAISAGIGIPFAALKSNSVFNIGVLYGSRSNGTTIGLSENFLSLNFGIVLAPSSYEKWFKKYKLD